MGEKQDNKESKLQLKLLILWLIIERDSVLLKSRYSETEKYLQEFELLSE